MDKELLESIRQYIKGNPSLRELSTTKARRLADNVAEKFIKNRSSLWWWESLNSPAQEIGYENEDGLAKIKAIIGSNEIVSLVVTDDEHEPWSAFEGPMSSIIELIGEQRFFEFFIVNEELNRCIFDTHHNSLIVVGEQALGDVLASPSLS